MLANKIDYKNPIERALYLIEGESPTISIDKADDLNRQVGKKHVCCTSCWQPTVKIEVKPDGRPAPWCLLCEDWVKARLMMPKTVQLKQTRNSGRSKPPVDLDVSWHGGALSKEALDWLLWGHGAKYRGDKILEESKGQALVWAMYYELEQTARHMITDLDKSMARAVGESITIITEVVHSSRAGRATITPHAMAAALGKHHQLLAGDRPAGRVYDYAKRKIRGWEDEIYQAFR